MKRILSSPRAGRLLAAAAALALPVFPANAASDPARDFLGTYAGPQASDLDILDTTGLFDGTGFSLTATLGGVPFTTPNSLLAWGINRGAGTARFQIMGGPPPVGADVRFDAVFVLFGNGTGRTVVFNPIGPPTITPVPGGIVMGNTITAYAPLALLPSTGFAAQDYQFTLWTRRRINPAFDTDNTEIADFGPTITAMVPEPSSWALLILGFGVVGAGLRRRARRASGERASLALA